MVGAQKGSYPLDLECVLEDEGAEGQGDPDLLSAKRRTEPPIPEVHIDKLWESPATPVHPCPPLPPALAVNIEGWRCGPLTYLRKAQVH